MRGRIHRVPGASTTRSTNTWSPINKVFSIELEGISKACRQKVMMNSPTTSTPAIEAMNSLLVSRFFSGLPLAVALVVKVFRSPDPLKGSLPAPVLE
jgi:hypothetical protein